MDRKLETLDTQNESGVPEIRVISGKDARPEKRVTLEPLNQKEQVATVIGSALLALGFSIIFFPEIFPAWVTDSLWAFLLPLYAGLFLLSYGQGRRLSSSLLDIFLKPNLPSSLDKITDPPMGSKEFEDLRVKLKFELRKTQISVNFSNLSLKGKNQCLQLLDEAEVSLATAHTVGELKHIGDLIDTASRIKDIIKRESSFVVIYTVVILSLLALLGAMTWQTWSEIAFNQSIFGLPLVVLLWSAIGGFVSVLFRYVFQQEEFQEPTPKWLFIRPIMGVVLGTVTYFAFATGLFLLNGDFDINELLKTRSLVFIILAFLSGFSDKFALFILSSVMGRVAPGWASQPEGMLVETRPRRHRVAAKDEKDNNVASNNGSSPTRKKSKVGISTNEV